MAIHLSILMEVNVLMRAVSIFLHIELLIISYIKIIGQTWLLLYLQQKTSARFVLINTSDSNTLQNQVEFVSFFLDIFL